MPNQLIKITSLFISLILLSTGQAGAGWPWQDNTLLTIDDEKYTVEDFRNWWSNWQEDDQPLPDTPDPFVDWILQYREAERMRLFEDPYYQRKILTFLKARTLMLLKAEEIDSKIKIRDRDIRARYEKLYVPLYHVTILSFATRDDADNLLARIDTAPVDEALLEKLAKEPANKVQLKEEWLRPSSFSPENLSAVQQLKPGQLSSPLPEGQGCIILFLHETSAGSREDYASVEKMIRHYLWKKQEGERTNALLAELRRSYAVTVDEKRLKAIDIDAPLKSFSAEPLITTKKGAISEKMFMAQLEKQKRFNVKNNFASRSPTAFKQQVLNGIIDQTLTSWEGLARGYENKPPLQAQYTFYRQHRLIKSLEQRVLKISDKITEEEIEKYYRDHIKEFTTPEIIRMSIIEGEQKAMNSLWTDVAMGGDFRQLTAKFFGHVPPVRDLPADHLEPEVRAVVNGLSKGELSPVFTVNGHLSLLLLVDRKPARTISLQEVATHIADLISQQKTENKRKEFLARLRGQSSIEIHDQVWQKLKKEIKKTEGENGHT